MNHTPIEKAIILARGLGTRMRKQDDDTQLRPEEEEVAATGVKALIPIDRPFLDYVLSALADAGFRRVCLVIGPEHDEIREYYGNQVETDRLSIEFAVQQEPRGTADAVAAAEGFTGPDGFVMLNSDNYYPVEALTQLRRIEGNGVALFERDAMLHGSNIPAERIQRFAVGRITPDDCLEQILEKPDAATLASLPLPLWVGMNCWRFGPSIYEACRNITPSPRGEYEVTDAVQYVIDQLGESFRVIRCSLPVLDLTGRQDVVTVRPKLKGVCVRL